VKLCKIPGNPAIREKFQKLLNISEILTLKKSKEKFKFF
jgi:hypothetical protein